MVRYNIYHGNNKINKFPLNESDIREIIKYKIVNKKISETETKQYNLDDLKIIKCIVV